MTAEDIKQRLNDRAPEFAKWLFPDGKKENNHWRVGSLNGEKGKSLGICIAGSKVGAFKDFATEEGGNNLVELLAQARHIAYKDALRSCAVWLGVPSLDTRGTPPKPTSLPTTSPMPIPMLDSEYEQGLAMAVALREDRALCERIARSRNWRTETIIELTYEPSLGWHDGKLAFLYESGCKLRWRENGERVIRWAFGKPWLWRGGYLWCRSNILIAEGETDAITLIDSGVEDDRETLVVALPSASTFNEEWAILFRGKHVALCFDGDDAGERAVARVSQLLQPPLTESLERLNWEGLRNASRA